MRWLFDVLTSSIGRKVLMSLTGLFLCTFLVVHLYGNLLLFAGEEEFNHHAEFFGTNILIRVVEVLLFSSLVLHAASGVWVTGQNRKARPDGYVRKRFAGKSTFASRSMLLSGSLIFIYLVIHLRDFFYTYHFGQPQPESLYVLVTATFADLTYAILYSVAMVLLGAHLIHGFQSGFKTLGLQNSRYTAAIRGAGIGFSVLVAGAFLSLPIYFYVISL